jgi:hypothetical protein
LLWLGQKVLMPLAAPGYCAGQGLAQVTSKFSIEKCQAFLDRKYLAKGVVLSLNRFFSDQSTIRFVRVKCKGGHLQFKSATPQYCGQPN